MDAGEDLTRRFLIAVADRNLSYRDIDRLTGINRTTFGQLKAGVIKNPHGLTRRRMQEFLAQAGQEPSIFSRETEAGKTLHRAVALLAAERLEEMAAQLREEAGGPDLTNHARDVAGARFAKDNPEQKAGSPAVPAKRAQGGRGRKR